MDPSFEGRGPFFVYKSLYLISMNYLPSPYQLLTNSYHSRC